MSQLDQLLTFKIYTAYICKKKYENNNNDDNL